MKKFFFITILFIIAFLVLDLNLYKGVGSTENSDTNIVNKQNNEYEKFVDGTTFEIDLSLIDESINQYYNANIKEVIISSTSEQVDISLYNFQDIFPNIDSFIVYGDSINEIIGLEKLKQVNEFDFSNTNIKLVENLNGLDEVENISVLYLDNTKVDTISGLENLNFDLEGIVLSFPYNCSYITKESYNILFDSRNTVLFVHNGSTPDRTLNYITRSLNDGDSYESKTYYDLMVV
ncbi:MAG: hypothetical protein ACK5HR_06965 [Mycoplasmatales bacterium]